MNESTQPEAVPTPPNKYMQMMTDALADPNTPAATRAEILESQARLAAQKA